MVDGALRARISNERPGYWQRAGELHMRAERITGGTVRAFVSGIDANADVATETFYLKPRD